MRMLLVSQAGRPVITSDMPPSLQGYSVRSVVAMTSVVASARQHRRSDACTHGSRLTGEQSAHDCAAGATPAMGQKKSYRSGEEPVPRAGQGAVLAAPCQ